MINAYAPVSISASAAAFARMVVAQAVPCTPARAKAFLFAAGRLARFGQQVGLDLSGDRLFEEATVERFILEGCDGLAPATVRTLRTNLRALSRALERYPAPLPVPLARERAKPPYTQAQIDGYLRLAACQSTHARRMRASALICLGAGAGVIAGELRALRGSDVVERAGGTLVLTGGRRARQVPVIGRYRRPLLEAASFAGEGLILGGRLVGRRNITDSLVAALSADCSLPRLEAGRLRSTWLCECAQRIGLRGFMQAAGITCSQRLGDLAAQLPPVSQQQLLALLGGSM